MPDLACAVEAKAGFMDTHDLLPDLVIAPGTRRTQLRIGKASRVFVPGGRGDRQFAADRLDTQFPVMSVDERHHHLPWRHGFWLAPPAQNMPMSLRQAQDRITQDLVGPAQLLHLALQ